MKKLLVVFVLLVFTGVSGYFVYNEMMTKNTSESATPMNPTENTKKENVQVFGKEFITRERVIAFFTTEYKKDIDLHVAEFPIRLQKVKGLINEEYVDRYQDFLDSGTLTEESVRQQVEFMKSIPLDHFLPQDNMEMSVEESKYGENIYSVVFSEGNNSNTINFAIIDGELSPFPNDFIQLIEN